MADPEPTPSQVRARGWSLLVRALSGWAPRALLVASAFLVLASLGPKTGVAGHEPGEPPGGELTLTLRPRLDPSAGVAVYLELRGPAAAHVRALAMAPSELSPRGVESVRYLLVRDERGVIETTAVPRSGKLELRRAVVGTRLQVSYLAESQGGGAFGTTLRVSPGGLSGVGYTFLALPDIDAALDVRLRFELDVVEARSAASSLGVGREVRARATLLDLAHSFFVAGDLDVRGAEARLVTVGPTALDREATLRFGREVLGEARDLLAPGDGGPFTFFFTGEPGLGSLQRGAALYRSFAAWIDSGRGLDQRVKLLVAHEVVHRWIGRQLRFVAPDGVEARWFSEGFATYFARQVLLRRKALSPADLAAELRHDRIKQARAFAAAKPGAKGPLTDPYLRGSLYAERLERQLAARGESLEGVVVPLLARAAKRQAPLPLSAWRDALRAVLGPFAEAELDRLVIAGSEPILLDDVE